MADRGAEADQRDRRPKRRGEIDQPGLSVLREAVENALPEVPGPRRLTREATSGLSIALGSVPSGLASGLLAGVNPIYGLYACAVGPLVGGVFSSTRLMVVTSTSVAALTAGQALAGAPEGERGGTLFLMVLLIGLFQLLLGVLRLGRITDFVSHSVMTGFVAGIVVLTILSQIPTVAGYDASGTNAIAQTIEVFANPAEVDWISVGVGAVALGLAIVLLRTRFRNVAGLAGMIFPSAAVALLGLEGVQVVGEIPLGLPAPSLPPLSLLDVDVVTGALAVAVVILIQGAGVGQSVPNPGGVERDESRDFLAQGVANVAGGFFGTLPVGGSLSSTALGVISGARTRWSPVASGIWVGLIVLIAPNLLGLVAMPALGAILMLAMSSSIEPRDVVSVWRTGWLPRVAGVGTFLATLLLPIQIAVLLGVTASVLLRFVVSSGDISLVQLKHRPDGRVEEVTPARRLASDDVTVLDTYGSLSFAAAQKLKSLLPDPNDAEHPVVVLRLRGVPDFGATLIDVLDDYADKLDEAGGRLYLSGISKHVHDELIRTKKVHVAGDTRDFEATAVLGESTERAIEDAREWLARRDDSNA